MKIKYNFDFNEDGRFRCVKIDGSNAKVYYGNKALDIFERKGKSKYTKLKYTDDSIVLINPKSKVTIKNLDKIHSYGYIDYLKRNFKFIINSMEENQKEKHPYELIRQNKRKIIGSASALAIIALAITLALGSLKKTNSPEIDNPVTDEFELDEDNIIEDQIFSITDIINSTYEDENQKLINELEEEDNKDLIDELTADENQELADENTESYYESYTLNLYKSNTPDLQKAEDAKIFMDTIEKYSAKWGISSNLILAMLTQETGGYKPNLMQIEFDEWDDYPMTHYDFINHRYQTVVLTDNPENYNKKGYTIISRDDLYNKITNISVACVILRTSVEFMNGNIGAGIQCYNFGPGAMKDVLSACSKDTGVSVNDILSDQTSSTFMNYTDVMPPTYGDHEYLYNVSKYLDDNNIEYKTYDKNSDSTKIMQINVVTKTKSLY